ncbi:MAG: diguanylate cyclase [Fuerstiella sp.]
MPRLSSIHRITLGLVSLTVSLLLVAGLLGMIPNPALREEKVRRSFCESTAVSFMALATRVEIEQLQATLDQLRERNPDVASIGIRQSSGDLVIQSGPHREVWESSGPVVSNLDELIVPIEANGEKWGQLEVRWTSGSAITVLGMTVRPDLLLAAFVGLLGFVVFSLYLGRVMQHINPSRVVPSRVREALNSLSEGLLVLDRKQCIVLANESFAAAAGATAESLVGTRPDRLGFELGGDGENGEFPWETTAGSSQPMKGVLLTRGSGQQQRTFSVSTVPVRDHQNENRGVVASFEDVTRLQQNQQELRDALSSLKSSTDEVRKQNRELEWLATRDTLTGCLNRRSFFRDYESCWQRARDEQQPLAVMMIDIDHFKAVNDNHGHSMGDEVLRGVSRTLLEIIGSQGLVCRYGGEEFSVLLPETSIDQAEMKAEKIRLAVKALTFPELKITASLGVSALCQHPESPQDLLDQADKCLYVAKRGGRNQVVRWDKAEPQIDVAAQKTAPTGSTERQNRKASAIPYHAVAALTTALAHRDQSAAVHSRRVADLCVATAEGLLSLRECYVLEIAALLHDIGKIGIPDSILRKPGRLTAEELEMVHQYNRMSVDMVRGSFGASVLTEIVEQHVVHFDMSNAERGAGPGQKPSVAARILSIANAFDTMVSDLSYRSKMSRSEAFAELRRCAGSQFDPELVERFISAVKLRHHEHAGSEGRVTRESALSIGLLLEQLIAALDDEDVSQLVDITQSLQIAAARHGLTDIAGLAKTLVDTLDDAYDQIEIMQLAGELLDLCRSTQSTLLSAEQDIPVTA